VTDTNNHIKFIDTQSQLPEFWERSVLFFANLKALFFGNEPETRELSDEVGGVEYYGGRLIPILDLIFPGSHNVLLLERGFDPALCRYFKRELGLSLPRLSRLPYEHYLRPTPEEIKRIGAIKKPAVKWADGFVTDKMLVQWAEALGLSTVSSFEGSHRGNNKQLLHEQVKSLGLPALRTITADNEDEVAQALRALWKEGYRHAVVRAAVGASGIGMIRVEADEVPAAGIAEHFFYEGACLIQGWMEPGVHGIKSVQSPSVQLFLNEQSVQLFDITEQLLSQDSVHEGNLSPPSYLNGPLREEICRQAGHAGRWLHEQGYRGTGSVDFLVVYTESHTDPRVYVCEINARITGATYPAVLARHFHPEGAWLMRNLRLERHLPGEKVLRMLRDAGYLFRAGRSTGVLPVNLISDEDGCMHKGQFLFMGDSGVQCTELLNTVSEKLSVRFHHDRD